MKELIFATVFMCIGSNCEQHQVRIEERACHMGTVNAQIPMNGEWQEGKIGIKCHK
jgi:hypothetical protein